MNSIPLTKEQEEDFIKLLQARFTKHTARHTGLEWSVVQQKLAANNIAIQTLWNLEQTGGEPDVVRYDKEKNEVTFIDCSPESPKGRRSVCYDQAALDSRKTFKPAHSAVAMAAEMGAELLSEQDYRFLQTLGEFDLKTSSWVVTPMAIRTLGGGLFCDKRYNTVFTYHNGVESYYAARGFRCLVKV
jgi:Protein of unknown function (DUF4256)